MAAPRQSKCGKCGKTVGYGQAVVVELGGGGRYHFACLPGKPERPVRKTKVARD